MEKQPYRACARACDGPNRWFMHVVASCVEAFTTADLRKLEERSPVVAAEAALAARLVRVAKVLKHLAAMKAFGPSVAAGGR